MDTQLRLIAISACYIIFLSCTSTGDKTLNQYILKSFKESENTISQSTSLMLESMEDMTFDPARAERATIWFKKADLTHKATNSLFETIDSLCKINSAKETISKIYQKTAEYKSLVLNDDEGLINAFGNQFNFFDPFITLSDTDSLEKTNTPNIKIEEKNITLWVASLKNKIRNLENKIIHSCYIEIPFFHHFYDAYSMIAGQNANILSPGSVLEIKAGIGSFSRASKPTITFDGKPVALNEEGFALFSKKVPDTPGNYKTPVRISFFNQTTGKDEVKQVNIEYKVVKQCD